MSTSYTPKPRAQQTFTKPQDGDNKDVASINIAVEGLADSDARTHLAEAMEWGPAITTAKDVVRGAYSLKEQSWFTVGPGANDFLLRSQDSGRSWVDLSGTIGVDDALSTYDIAINAAGQAVIINVGTQDIYESAYGGYAGFAFSTSAGVLNAAMTAGQIIFEEVNDLWLALYRTTGSGMRADTSPNRTAWTNQTLPAGWAAYNNSTQNPRVAANDAGRIVALFYDDTALNLKYRFAYSTDGGVNWTAGTALTPGFGPATDCVSKPTYDPDFDDWYFCAAETTGTNSTEVYRSEDGGATWSIVYSNINTDNYAFVAIAWFNGVLVASNIGGRIFFSTDRGVTWKLATRNLLNGACRPWLSVGNGQLLVIDDTDNVSYVTRRLGAVGGG